jgi:hypothetical protein
MIPVRALEGEQEKNEGEERTRQRDALGVLAIGGLILSCWGLVGVCGDGVRERI